MTRHGAATYRGLIAALLLFLLGDCKVLCRTRFHEIMGSPHGRAATERNLTLTAGVANASLRPLEFGF